MTDLQQLVADLEFAAGEGAQHVGADVVRSARIEAEVGIHVAQAGRALVASGQAVASEQAQGNTGASASTVAAHMAEQAAEQGAALAVGRR